MIHPSQIVSALGTAARNADIRRIQLAWGAAIASEWAHFVALGVFAYNTGGTSAVGVAGLVRLLPAAIVAPFAASLGDRFRRERFLLALTLIGAAALAGSAVAAFAHQRILVFGLAAVVGLVATLFRPALQALLPSLARTPEELIAANGATSTIEGLGTLAGPLLAGVLVAVFSPGVVFAVSAGVLLAGAALLALVTVEGRIELSGADGAASIWRLLGGGFRAVVGTPGAALVVGLIVAQTFVRGCVNVLIVVAVFRVFHGGASQVGYLTAAIGVGGLIGALGAMTLKGRRLAGAFGVALVCWGLPLVLIAPRPYFAAAVVLLAVVGAANALEDVAVFTLLQRIVPDETLTRVLGLVWGLAMGGVAVGSIATPVIVNVLGPRAAFAVVGSILPLLTLVAYRRLVQLDRAVLPASELGLIEDVPMFAPLSLAAKEHVAKHLVPVTVEAGELVIRAGDLGDRFYIVAEGELDVDVDGRHSSVGPGGYFGEIALLRDVPRTATVTATVDSRLFAVERDDFLAAVTGHSAAHAAGEAVVDERLAEGVGYQSG
jgi:MFS family permease